MMRIAVHDFGGYAFPAELSRALAGRGHVVQHFVCADVFSGKADMREDPSLPTLSFAKVASSHTAVRKYDPIQRLRWEWEYGTRLAGAINRFRPDVVLSANTPLLAQHRLFTRLDRGIARVIWLQDLVSVAIERHLAAKSRLARGLFAPALRRLELSLVDRADRVVAIAPQFIDFLREGGVDTAKLVELRNWAPVTDLPLAVDVADWRRANGVGDDFVVVYSGTLGLKHNALALAEIARRLPSSSRVVVLAEGPGLERLREEARDLPNLDIRGFVDYAELPVVLGAADVLIALLEPDASNFSVPSKVLTYLCAGRPIIAAMPHDNLASQIVRDEAEAGVVVAPDDLEGIAAAVEALRLDPRRAAALGRAGRAYVETEFDIDRITDRFSSVLAASVQREGHVVAPAAHPVTESMEAAP